jgi:hypothetical protein
MLNADTIAVLITQLTHTILKIHAGSLQQSVTVGISEYQRRTQKEVGREQKTETSMVPAKNPCPVPV